MGLLLVLIAIITLGVVIFVKYKHENTGFLITVIGSVCLFFCSMGIIVAHTTSISLITQYNQDKIYFDSHYNSTSGVERVKCADIAIVDNAIIEKYRVKTNSFWVGWMFPIEIAELKTFDLEKIKTDSLTNTKEK